MRWERGSFTASKLPKTFSVTTDCCFLFHEDLLFKVFQSWGRFDWPWDTFVTFLSLSFLLRKLRRWKLKTFRLRSQKSNKKGMGKFFSIWETNGFIEGGQKSSLQLGHRLDEVRMGKKAGLECEGRMKGRMREIGRERVLGLSAGKSHRQQLVHEAAQTLLYATRSGGIGTFFLVNWH